MSDCTKYEEMLSEFLDGELSRNDASELRNHLEICADCRRTYRDFSAISENMHALIEDAPFILSSKVMIQTEKQPFAAPASVPVRKRRRSPLRIILPVAAACLIIAVGIIYLHMPRSASAELSTSETLEESAAEIEGTDTVLDVVESLESDDDENGAVMYFNADTAENSAEETDTAGENAEIMNVIVSDDQAEAFETIIAVGDGPTEDPSTLNVLCTAEYRGVVYEFLTNKDSSALYWMDAAEGTVAIYSNSDVVTLFSILGIS